MYMCKCAYIKNVHPENAIKTEDKISQLPILKLDFKSTHKIFIYSLKQHFLKRHDRRKKGTLTF